MHDTKKDQCGIWQCDKGEQVYVEELLHSVNEAYRSIPGVAGPSGPEQKKIVVKIIADCNGAGGMLERLKNEDRKFSHIRWIFFYFASNHDELSVAGDQGGRFTADLLIEEFKTCEELDQDLSNGIPVTYRFGKEKYRQ